jgi:hypothetical protein
MLTVTVSPTCSALRGRAASVVTLNVVRALAPEATRKIAEAITEVNSRIFIILLRVELLPLWLPLSIS